MGNFMKEEKWDASFQDTMLKIMRTLPQFLKYLPERCYLCFCLCWEISSQTSG